MRKYRIKEFDGKFNIQVKKKVKVKKYFWQKIEYEDVWVDANFWGNPMRIYRHIPASDVNSKTYLTLSEATEQIKSWQKGTIYHNIS